MHWWSERSGHTELVLASGTSFPYQCETHHVQYHREFPFTLFRSFTIIWSLFASLLVSASHNCIKIFHSESTFVLNKAWMPLALPLQARNIGVHFLLFYSHLPQGPPPLRPDMKINCLSGLDTILQLAAVFNFFSPLLLSPINNLGSTTSLCSWLISSTRPSSLAQQKPWESFCLPLVRYPSLQRLSPPSWDPIFLKVKKLWILQP